MPKTVPLKTNADALTLLAEKMKANAGRPNLFGYRPHAKQEMFHASQAKKRLYIGGNRSGKTTGGIIEDLWWLRGEHPYRQVPNPCRGRIISVDFLNGIEKIIRPEIARWCPLSDLEGGSWATAYHKETRTLHFANGSFVEFMSYDQDLDKFAGTSRHFVHYDEEPPEDIYSENQARLIDTGGSSWVTMTPVEGMTWIYDTLYMPGRAGGEGIDVIEVSMTENPHLNEAEVQAYIEGLSEDERQARAHGRFVQLGGLIYKEFDPRIHVVDPVLPPKDWTWVASLDHGFNNPTAWLWHAVSPDGKILTFSEHYESGQTIDYHARKVHEINARHGRAPDYYVGDPSIRNTDPITGTSIHEEYIKHGVPITLGNNDVAAGVNRVAQYLKVVPGSAKPTLHMTRNCVNLIWEMQRYRWKTYANKRLSYSNNAHESAHKKDDHACDALRYFIMSRPDLTGGFSDPLPAPVSNPFGMPVAVEATGRLAPTHASEQQEWQTEGTTTWQVDEMMGADW